MWERLKGTIKWIREYFAARAGAEARAADAARNGTTRAIDGVRAARGLLVGLAVLGGIGYWLYLNPPYVTVGRGEVGVRLNHFTGEVSQWKDGSVLVLPALHEMRVFPLKDQTYRPAGAERADGQAPFQSLEGLSRSRCARRSTRRRWRRFRARCPRTSAGTWSSLRSRA